ncbi:flagellar assembly protein A [Effusibacillus pohliae]|uniref:flagellar assembly protein A n=1 Tax=Effusibacillus pohliae TaxID=232270 RepID=UPI000375F7D5|nr:FapA family protein [Effusibacillus pohliae]
MFGVIVSRGKTVEKAVRRAARQLQVSKEEIEFEVIDQGRRGLFFHRPVVIQATVKRKSEIATDINKQFTEIAVSDVRPQKKGKETEMWLQMPSPGTLLETVSNSKKELSIEAPEGTAWVKDGKIFCKNGEYHYPLLTICEGATVLINGQPARGTVIVTEEDQIDVRLEEEVVDSTLKLTVSDDKMHVLLEFVPGYYIIRELKDLPPSRELVLEVVETKIAKNDFTEFYILDKLKEIGVRFGIDYDEIERVCQSQEPVTTVIAKGIEPVPGEDGGFELFHEKLKKQKDQLILSESIDWKERFSLPSIGAGEIIGRPTPAKPGTSGWNVFGETVPVPQVKELTVIAGEGTTVYGLDRKIVATRSGRIKIDRRSNNTLCFSILPQFIHRGNVNMDSGNIRFRGDVYILGDVEEGMYVEAGGNLYIMGSVSNATVKTGGDAKINGSAVGSTIICGYSNLFWDDMLPKFKEIRDDLVKLIVVVKQLGTNRAFTKSDIGKKGLQPLLKLLTEIKFKKLPVLIREVGTVIKDEKDSFDEDTFQVVDFLEKSFLYFHPLIKTLDQLDSVVKYMENVISAVEFDSNKKMNIQVQSLTNSSIKSAWDVVVERFCYGSDIYCKGSMKAETLRGGKVQAGNSVVASEIGSKGGSLTEVWVKSAEGFIKTERVYPDTVVKISTVSKKFIEETGPLHVRLNREYELIYSGV